MKALMPLILCTVFLAGCTQEGRLISTPEEDVTYDGLVRSNRADLQNVWLKPGIDFSVYNRVILEEPQLEFRAFGSQEDPRYRKEQFPLTADDKRNMTQMVQQVFSEEFAKLQNYTMTDQSGTDVLILRSRIIDILKLVPRQDDDLAREPLGTVTEATGVAELYDSESGEILARSVARRGKGYAGNIQSARSKNWSPLKPSVQRWAGEIRDRLDQIHSL
jgi:hypothetical protein